MFPRVIALLLTLAMWPGLSELVELTVHAVEHGDVAHADGDEHGGVPLGEDEHGCSGTFHLCPCHQVAPVMASTDEVDVSTVGLLAASAQLTPVLRLGVGLAAPPTRPPIV